MRTGPGQGPTRAVCRPRPRRHPPRRSRTSGRRWPSSATRRRERSPSVSDPGGY